jgi:hypothetical protein
MRFLWLMLAPPLLVGLYIGYIYLEAWVITRAQPREEGFMCDKHGLMQKRYTISFAGVAYCAICFHEKLETMEKIPTNGAAS